MNVEVRIRHHSEAGGKYLTHWPIERLEDLIRTLGSWGVYAGDDPESDIIGQFSLDPAPHFDLIVGADV